jgi:hypothetical protein
MARQMLCQIAMRAVKLGFWVLIVATSCSNAADKATRVPAVHRAASSACPQERGAGITSVGPACTQPACAKDSDCAAGANGRCVQGGGPACNYFCSYDDCAQDSDCAGQAPCACRASSSDATANTCEAASNCGVDADCGPGGFCSPSLLMGGAACQCFSEAFCQADTGSSCSETGPDGVTKAVPCSCPGDCGRGYFCHTPKDSCVDDADCAGGACSFDLTSGSWMCTRQICEL